ncbi:MAG TPA: helix-turn-helix transcriptional regulator [Bryobacteraceae bacterium]|nr:helix-turn-helix transcriptional regulator [Bryobacteraceae bacterium]
MAQEQLAKWCGCSHYTIKAVELGRLELSPSLAERISLVTGVPPEYLLENKISAPGVFAGFGENWRNDQFGFLFGKRTAHRREKRFTINGLTQKGESPPFNASRRIPGSSRPVIIITLLSGDK